MKRRTDPHTGEYFQPFRTNQKFASRENQIAYNNAVAKKQRDYLKEIDHFVKNNWKVLQEILGEKKLVLKSKDYLIGCGYDFRFLNNLRQHNGYGYYATYNYGIRKIDDKKYEIVNFESYE